MPQLLQHFRNNVGYDQQVRELLLVAVAIGYRN
jgi:hypothetical protein